MKQTHARALSFFIRVLWIDRRNLLLLNEKKNIWISVWFSDVLENLFVNFSAWLYRYLSRMLAVVFVVWMRISIQSISKWIVQQ